MGPSHFGAFSVYVAVNKILKPRQAALIFRICRRRETNELNLRKGKQLLKQCETHAA